MNHLARAEQRERHFLWYAAFLGCQCLCGGVANGGLFARTGGKTPPLKMTPSNGLLFILTTEFRKEKASSPRRKIVVNIHFRIVPAGRAAFSSKSLLFSRQGTALQEPVKAIKNIRPH